jgi:hypothetical protein
MIDVLAKLLGARASRRAAFGLLPALAVPETMSLRGRTCGTKREVRAWDIRAIKIKPVYYTDAAGRELATIRPFSLENISLQAGIDTPPNQRDFVLWLRIVNTSGGALSVPPEAFALWGDDGLLYRPQDVLSGRMAELEGKRTEAAAAATASATPGGGIATPPDFAEIVHEGPDDYDLMQMWFQNLLTADPIAAGDEDSGAITFRVSERACLSGLLFTPEPDRIYVVADFSRFSSVVID